MGKTIWTPENDNALREMWADNMRVAFIAARLGVTKNAAIGRAHRLGLDGHKGAHGRKQGPTRAMFRAAKRAAREWAKANGLPKAPKPAATAPSAPPPPRFLTLMQLRRRDCRYSVSAEAPHFFCGAPVKDGGPWCDYHHAICHEAPRKRPADKPHAFRLVDLHARAA